MKVSFSSPLVTPDWREGENDLREERGIKGGLSGLGLLPQLSRASQQWCILLIHHVLCCVAMAAVGMVVLVPVTHSPHPVMSAPLAICWPATIFEVPTPHLD